MKNNNIDQIKVDGWRQIIDEIHHLSIIDIISRYISLKPQGSSQKANCPFHNDSSPSFSVSEKYGRYKCFGCNKSGDSIDFVQNFKGFTFLEAVKEIAKQHNIAIPDDHFDKTTSENWASKNSLYEANRFAMNWFNDQLYKEENALELEYAQSRWNYESLSRFSIGFAPRSGNLFLKAAQEACFKEEILFEAGLISKDESTGIFFDFFRNRLIFPIINSSGKVAGFSGRSISENDKAPKYINTRQSPIYQKGELLYGLHLAKNMISKNKTAYLVEGYADVITLHQLDITNTIGICGTALTEAQVDTLKKLTDTVIIIGDTDTPGMDSMERSAEMLVKSGIHSILLCLPDGPVKQDPDSFFKSKQSFLDYEKNSRKDYIFHLAEEHYPDMNSPARRDDFVQRVCTLINFLPESSHGYYLESLSKIIKPKKLLESTLNNLSRNQNSKESKSQQIPESVNQDDVVKYGFYEQSNCYFFVTRDVYKCKSNFTMTPLYLIASTINARRIFRLNNKFGDIQEIELPQKDLNSVSSFRLRVESLGNFIFEGSDNDLMKIKMFLYERTVKVNEVPRLGWQKGKKIWAWADGLYKDVFMPVDEIGIVKYENETFYLPASSRMYQKEETLYIQSAGSNFIPGPSPCMIFLNG